MRAWALCGGLILVVACDRKPVDPSPITRIPGLAPPLDSRRGLVPDSAPIAAKPTPHEDGKGEDEPAVAEPVRGGPTPTAAQLAEAFRIHYRSSNALALWQQDVLIEGNAKGAWLTMLDLGQKGGAAPTFARYRLDAAAVAQLLAKLDGSLWWTLKNDRQPVMDGTAFSLKQQRGDFAHALQILNGCACDARRPTEAADETCKCPQLDVMDLVGTWFQKLPAKSRVEVAAPKTGTFKPPKISEKLKRGAALACEAGPNGTLACENQRCFPQGKLVACFRSPFMQTGVLGQPQKKKKSSRREEPTKGTARPWAIQTEDGQKCAGAPLPTDFETWSCVTESKDKRPRRDDQVVRVIQAGAGMIAVWAREDFRVTPVTVLWP